MILVITKYDVGPLLVLLFMQKDLRSLQIEGAKF